MFDSEFDDLTPSQFPKTDINFYMLANNSSALEPWNKTSYKLRPSSRLLENKSGIKRRNLSYDSYEKAIRFAHKRRSSTGFKNQVTLSTLTFHLQADPNNNGEQRPHKKPSYHSMIKSKRNMFHSQYESKPSESGLLPPENTVNRGFTNTLRHTNLLKLKQEHQNKLKQIITKKQIYGKQNSNSIRLGKIEKGAEEGQREHSPVNLNNIVLGEEPRVVTHEYMRKPKKVSYVGIRKIFNCPPEK